MAHEKIIEKIKTTATVTNSKLGKNAKGKNKAKAGGVATVDRAPIGEVSDVQLPSNTTNHPAPVSAVKVDAGDPQASQSTAADSSLAMASSLMEQPVSDQQDMPSSLSSDSKVSTAISHVEARRGAEVAAQAAGRDAYYKPNIHNYYLSSPSFPHNVNSQARENEAKDFHHNVPNKVAHYIEIEEYQSELLNKFVTIEGSLKSKINDVSGIKIAIVGIGGAGKTELAKNFALDYFGKNEDTVVWFFNAANENSLIVSCCKFIQKLTEEEIKQNSDEDEIHFKQRLVSKVNESLQGKRWLLIFDNADNIDNDKAYTRISGYFPSCGTALDKIIVTTRESDFFYHDNDKECIDLNRGLEKNNAANFLLKIAELNEGHLESALALVGQLDPLPLTLSSIGLYIKNIRLKNTHFGFSNFSAALSENRQLEEQKLSTLQKKHDCYKFTQEEIIFSILTSVTKNNCNVSSLLIFCGFLSADHIPSDLLRHWVSNELPAEDNPDCVLEDCLIILREHSLLNEEVNLTADTSNRLFYIHRITQEIIIRKFVPIKNRITQFNLVMQAIGSYVGSPIFTDINSQGRNKLKKMFQHILSIEEKSSSPEYSSIDNLAMVDMFNYMAQYNLFWGDFLKAISYVDRAIRSSKLKHTEKYAESLHIKSRFYWRKKGQGALIFIKDCVDNSNLSIATLSSICKESKSEDCLELANRGEKTNEAASAFGLKLDYLEIRHSGPLCFLAKMSFNKKKKLKYLREVEDLLVNAWRLYEKDEKHTSYDTNIIIDILGHLGHIYFILAKETNRYNRYQKEAIYYLNLAEEKSNIVDHPSMDWMYDLLLHIYLGKQYESYDLMLAENCLKKYEALFARKNNNVLVTLGARRQLLYFKTKYFAEIDDQIFFDYYYQEYFRYQNSVNALERRLDKELEITELKRRLENNRVKKQTSITHYIFVSSEDGVEFQFGGIGTYINTMIINLRLFYPEIKIVSITRANEMEENETVVDGSDLVKKYYIKKDEKFDINVSERTCSIIKEITSTHNNARIVIECEDMGGILSDCFNQITETNILKVTRMHWPTKIAIAHEITPSDCKNEAQVGRERAQFLASNILSFPSDYIHGQVLRHIFNEYQPKEIIFKIIPNPLDHTFYKDAQEGAREKAIALFN